MSIAPRLLATVAGCALSCPALAQPIYVQAGIGTDVGPWLFAWPLAKIIAVLPVTLNGLGLREGVLASMLVPFGADAAAIVAAGLVWQAVMFTVGGIGAISVFKAVYIDKRDLRCACVGGDSNVPLGFVSLTENVMMVAMAVWMLAK